LHAVESRSSVINTTNETQEAFPINGICIHMPVEDGTGDSLDDEDDVKTGESSMHMAGSL